MPFTQNSAYWNRDEFQRVLTTNVDLGGYIENVNYYFFSLVDGGKTL